ncbi:DUF6207 family protein [Streptomyces collinus]|uniref:DUF6207 family protein n=1 Tax=Streptomyces collinus TaxID=42684 RepID=UPI0036B2E57D
MKPINEAHVAQRGLAVVEVAAVDGQTASPQLLAPRPVLSRRDREHKVRVAGRHADRVVPPGPRQQHDAHVAARRRGRLHPSRRRPGLHRAIARPDRQPDGYRTGLVQAPPRTQVVAAERPA